MNMNRPLLILIFVLLPFSIQPGVSDDRCIDAADYKGCMEFHSDTEKGSVDVQRPKDNSYRPNSVRQQKVRGKYGRYIVFTGTTLNEYSGTPSTYNPGSPGRKVCNTVISFNGKNKTTTCQQVGYIAPSYNPGIPAGVERRSFRYQLDCQDRTFDRKGDYSGFGNKGWMNISSDPTAQAVADRYCPHIDRLPKEIIDQDGF